MAVMAVLETSPKKPENTPPAGLPKNVLEVELSENVMARTSPSPGPPGVKSKSAPMALEPGVKFQRGLPASLNCVNAVALNSPPPIEPFVVLNPVTSVASVKSSVLKLDAAAVVQLARFVNVVKVAEYELALTRRAAPARDCAARRPQFDLNISPPKLDPIGPRSHKQFVCQCDIQIVAIGKCTYTSNTYLKM